MNVSVPHLSPTAAKAPPSASAGVPRPLVALRGVSKVFSNGTVALQNISLDIAQG